MRYQTYITVGGVELSFKEYSSVAAIARDIKCSPRLVVYHMSGDPPKKECPLKYMRIEKKLKFETAQDESD